MGTELNPGQKFGKLTVVGSAPNIRFYRAYVFRCECGREKAYPASLVVNGRQRSCGCTKKKLFNDHRFGTRKKTIATSVKGMSGDRVSLIKARKAALDHGTADERLDRLSRMFKSLSRGIV